MKAKDEKDGTLELSEEQYEKLLIDLEDFEEQFYRKLAESDHYEIIPTATDDGRPLGKEQLSLLTKECHRLGYRYLYKVDHPNGIILLVNPKTLKIGYISDGVH